MSATFSIGARGVLCAWSGPLGPCVARFDSWTREQPRFVRALGHAGTEIAHRPRLWSAPSAIVAVFCERAGAFMVALDDEGTPLSSPIALVPDAYEVALVPASDRERALVYCADPEGIVEVEIGVEGPTGPPVRRVAEERVGAMLGAALVLDQPLVAIAHRGGDAFGLLAPGERVVDHALSAPCEGLHLRSNGSRAMLALQLAGGRTQVALLGARGRVIERPHEVVAADEGRTESARVLWEEDRWALAWRGGDGSIAHRPIGERGASFRLPRSSGAFAIEHHAASIYTLEVEPGEGERATLSSWRCGRDGRDQEQRRIEVVAINAGERALERAMRRCFEGLAERMHGGSGYRSTRRPRLASAECALRWDDARGSVALEARAVPEDGELELRVQSHLGASEVEPVPSSLLRLARYVRERISPQIRARRIAEVFWAEELAYALDASLGSVEPVGPSLSLVLHMAAAPDPEALERWIRRLRDEHAARRASTTS